MSEEKRTIEILEEINITLQEINNRQDTKEVFAETDKELDKVDQRVEHSINQIQVCFDRIHDKVFNFNNIMIAAYLVLGTFPSDFPKIPLWTSIFPITNLVYLIFIDINQMEIHRFATNELTWTSKDRVEFGEKIKKQTKLSLYAMGVSLMCLFYITINLF